MSNVSYRWLLTGTVLTLLISGCAIVAKNALGVDQSTVADMPTIARAASGDFISWREHRIDDQDINGGFAIRGGDGIAVGDIDGDGLEDLVTAHEDSNQIRVAFSNGIAERWTLRTIADDALAGAVEDVALVDLNNDVYSDVVAACENAYLLYLHNPGKHARSSEW